MWIMRSMNGSYPMVKILKVLCLRVVLHGIGFLIATRLYLHEIMQFLWIVSLHANTERYAQLYPHIPFPPQEHVFDLAVDTTLIAPDEVVSTILAHLDAQV